MGKEKRQLKGRREIVLPIDVEELTPDIIGNVLSHCLKIHDENVKDMELLENYLFGDRPITKRVKKIRPDIDNKVLVNYPVKIVRDLNSYFLEKPITWTSKNGEASNAIELLAKVLKSESKDLLDMELAQTVGTYGVGYRGQYSETSGDDEYPLLLANHSPLTTFVVKSSSAGNPDLFSVSIVENLDMEALKQGNVETEESYLVYTRTQTMVFKQNKDKYVLDGTAENHYFGGIPIVEYTNNQWRYGDFEMVVDLIDALDKIYSDRTNAVEQLVQSILVFINCEIDDETLDDLSNNLAISIKSYKGSTNQGGLDSSDVKFVTSPLNQRDTQSLADEIESYITALTGIMTRSTRPGGGQDTGEAVYLRDGGRDMETIARIKESSFMSSERKCLRIIANILKVNGIVDVDTSDIEIKFTRNASNNLLNKAHAIAILNNTKILKPEDTLSIAGISSAPVDMAERGVKYWDSREAALGQDESPRTQEASPLNDKEATTASLEGVQPSNA